jgi:hypothetical protein
LSTIYTKNKFWSFRFILIKVANLILLDECWIRISKMKMGKDSPGNWAGPLVLSMAHQIPGVGCGVSTPFGTESAGNPLAPIPSPRLCNSVAVVLQWCHNSLWLCKNGIKWASYEFKHCRCQWSTQLLSEGRLGIARVDWVRRRV